ncbi:hypothetical protein ACFL20_05365 [Spirochaetota bacterium]
MNSRKLIIGLVFLLTVPFALPEVISSKSGVGWYGYNKGIKLAKKYKRPTLLFFYASW